MKIKNILLVLFLHTLLYSATYEIKQDGTGDFTEVQSGIDACVSEDTVLVYPGTYYENLVILNKRITLGSLYLTTEDEAYISQTVLDGSHNSSVIRIEDSSGFNTMQVVGFVIQNGIGYQYNAPYEPNRSGGGLYVLDSSITISNCIIQNNFSTNSGGGITLSHSNLNLSGSTIRFNHCDKGAGGILIGGQGSDVNFDNENLNNIYMNYSGNGNDIYISPSSPFQEIIVDTFTVIDPDENYYYIFPGSGGAGIPLPGQFSTDIQHGYIQQVEQDLYVSAEGDDSNSGLSADDPLQSISYALVKIRSDSLQQRTIHIADGVYSASLNNQMFPIHIKSYIDIVGASRENTILDREQAGGLFYGNDGQKSYKIANLSLINCKDWPNIMITINTDVNIDNIYAANHTEDMDSSISYGSFVFNFNDVSCNRILSENNQDVGSIYYYSPNYGTEFSITNSVFRNNEPEYLNPGCLQIWCYRTITLEDSLIVNIINTEITNNIDAISEPMGLPSTSAIFIDWQTKLNLINSTIGDNECVYEGAAIQLEFESEANIINSIVYGNTPYNICLDGRDGPNTLNARNSLIQGGPADILQINTNYINWDDETMLDTDPLWLGEDFEYPYALNEYSPCIDAGTLDLPSGVELPAYDLAGNPRVMGSAIDMGAYEYPDIAAPVNLQIDNATLSWQMPEGFAASGYNIYLNGIFQTYVSSLVNYYIFPLLQTGVSYTAGVSAVYGNQETAIIPLQFVYQPVNIDDDESNILPVYEYQLTNYPNPFNPGTTFSFNLPQKGNVELAVYNIKGQKVKSILSAQLNKGEFTVSWNGKDESGKQIASGEYIARLKVDNEEKKAKKILFLK